MPIIRRNVRELDKSRKFTKFRNRWLRNTRAGKFEKYRLYSNNRDRDYILLDRTQLYIYSREGKRECSPCLPVHSISDHQIITTISSNSFHLSLWCTSLFKWQRVARKISNLKTFTYSRVYMYIAICEKFPKRLKIFKVRINELREVLIAMSLIFE